MQWSLLPKEIQESRTRSYIAEFLVAANVSCLKLHLLETDKLKLLTVFCHLTPPLEYLAWPSARLSRGILLFAEHSLMFTSHKSDQGRDEEWQDPDWIDTIDWQRGTGTGGPCVCLACNMFTKAGITELPYRGKYRGNWYMCICILNQDFTV